MTPLPPEEYQKRAAVDVIEELIYFAKHLTFKDRDERSVILIGHLLIEEQLIAYVRKNLKRPEKVERFTFIQYLQLAEALNDITAFDWIFHASRKLNSLRNKSSHLLAPLDLQGMTTDFVQYVQKNSGMNLSAGLIECNHSEFRTALLSVYAALRNLNRAYFPKFQIPTLLSGYIRDEK